MWKDNPLIEGITMSGGDPLLQPEKHYILSKGERRKSIGRNI